MRLELDRIFCIVDDLAHASRRLEHDGWVLDQGSVHEGQGTRNRCLAWPEQHLELLCVVDRVHAGTLAEVRVSGLSPALLPPYAGPPITQTSGPHHLELVVGRHGSAQPMTPILTIRG